MTHGRRKSALISLSPVAVVALSVAPCGGGGSAAAGSAAARASGGRSATVSVRNSVLGTILVDKQRRTLYLFAAGSRSMSACGGACAGAWPPLLAAGARIVGAGADPSLVSTIRRSGGARQLTYNGHPLYPYAGDQKPGDVNGQGVAAFGALWYARSRAGNQVFGSPSGIGAGESSPGGSGY